MVERRRRLCNGWQPATLCCDACSSCTCPPQRLCVFPHRVSCWTCQRAAPRGVGSSRLLDRLLVTGRADVGDTSRGVGRRVRWSPTSTGATTEIRLTMRSTPRARTRARERGCSGLHMNHRQRQECERLRAFSSEEAADYLLSNYGVESPNYGEAFVLLSHRSWKRSDQVRLARQTYQKSRIFSERWRLKPNKPMHATCETHAADAWRYAVVRSPLN